MVIHFFDRTLSRVILLGSFMPVIQAISWEHRLAVGDDLSFDPALTAGPVETAFQAVLAVTIFLLAHVSTHRRPPRARVPEASRPGASRAPR